MQYIGDTKAGTYVASDRYGNKYYENQSEELPLRTRWVDYKQKEYSPYVIFSALCLFSGMYELEAAQYTNYFILRIVARLNQAGMLGCPTLLINHQPKML